MKSIEFIAPVEAMRGNLSGTQQLVYAENNNPAYEAPNGQQYAKNYATRYIGAKRAANGLKYFAVKQRSSTTLNSLTRMQMGLIAVIAALKSSAGVNLAQLRSIWQSLKDTAGDAAPDHLKTFNKFFDYHMRRMLRYKETSHIIAGPGGSATIQNPFALDNANAAEINSITWVKFAPLFYITTRESATLYSNTIDGQLIRVFTDGTTSWEGLITETKPNANYAAQFTNLTKNEVSVLYNGLPIYHNNTAVTPTDVVLDNTKYTTIPPMDEA